MGVCCSLKFAKYYTPHILQAESLTSIIFPNIHASLFITLIPVYRTHRYALQLSTYPNFIWISVSKSVIISIAIDYVLVAACKQNKLLWFIKLSLIQNVPPSRDWSPAWDVHKPEIAGFKFILCALSCFSTASGHDDTQRFWMIATERIEHPNKSHVFNASVQNHAFAPI